MNNILKLIVLFFSVNIYSVNNQIEYVYVPLSETMSNTLYYPPALIVSLPKNYILVNMPKRYSDFGYFHKEDIENIEKRGGLLEGYVFKHGMFIFKMSGLSNSVGYFPDKKIFTYEMGSTGNPCSSIIRTPRYISCSKSDIYNSKMYQMMFHNDYDDKEKEYNLFTLDIGMNYDSWVYTIIYQGVKGKANQLDFDIWNNLIKNLTVNPKKIELSKLELHQWNPDFDDKPIYKNDKFGGNEYIDSKIDDNGWEIGITKINDIIKSNGMKYNARYTFDSNQELELKTGNIQFNEYLDYTTNLKWEGKKIGNTVVRMSPPRFSYHLFFRNGVLVFYSIEHRLSREGEQNDIKNESVNMDYYKDENYLYQLSNRYGSQRSESFIKYYNVNTNFNKTNK